MWERQNLSLFNQRRLQWQEPLKVGDGEYTVAEILNTLVPMLTDSRRERLQAVTAARTRKFVAILENIYDRGNISAVMRSLEAFGFLDLHLVESQKQRFKAANRVARGADKWLDVCYHSAAKSCVDELKGRGFQVYVTRLSPRARPVAEIDFSRPTALVLGNEKDGVTDEMAALCDGEVIIPMTGFSQSFNISVAAAICFYQVYQQRTERLGHNGDLQEPERRLLAANYIIRSFDNPARLLEEARSRGLI